MDTATAHQRRWWTLGVLCVSLLVIGLDNTILNVALPTLVEDLHATASQQQWIVDAYTLVSRACCSPRACSVTSSVAAAPSPQVSPSSAPVRW